MFSREKQNLDFNYFFCFPFWYILFQSLQLNVFYCYLFNVLFIIY